VCATLSFSGSGIFSQVDRPFEVLVVDEASQAVEPSALIPLCQGTLQVYLVGDPSQLPATVISSFAIKKGYNLGLFSRLMRAGYPIKRLKTQYRMHPLIREYPSTVFYGGLLQDGEGVDEQTIRPWHSKKCFGPISFYDIRGREERAVESASIFKEYEAQLSVEIFLFLTYFYPQLRSSSQVGIISPYKDQVNLIRRKLSEALGGFRTARKYVDIDTIDGFQGKEKDLVIFSAVRSKPIKNTGFISDERRLNVGLTRARSSIIVLGHAGSLSHDSSWQSLIEHCRDRGVLFKIN
jgi:senataxin